MFCLKVWKNSPVAYSFLYEKAFKYQFNYIYMWLCTFFFLFVCCIFYMELTVLSFYWHKIILLSYYLLMFFEICSDVHFISHIDNLYFLSRSVLLSVYHFLLIFKNNCLGWFSLLFLFIIFFKKILLSLNLLCCSLLSFLRWKLRILIINPVSFSSI